MVPAPSPAVSLRTLTGSPASRPASAGPAARQPLPAGANIPAIPGRAQEAPTSGVPAAVRDTAVTAVT